LLDIHVFSIDEKSGIQALEMVTGTAPMSKGLTSRTEFSYERHGTTCLIAALDVKDGKIVHYHIQPTRTEEDFANFMKELIAKIPKDDKAIFLMDQLNTHKSESLVRLFANELGIVDDLGKKEVRGILKKQESRMAFLEDTSHRLRIQFTPVHCSWLNPIENYFSKLQRQVIRRGNFPTIEDLKCKIVYYISYCNSMTTKPLKWKFKGFSKEHELKKSNSA
jgi:transposase